MRQVAIASCSVFLLAVFCLPNSALADRGGKGLQNRDAHKHERHASSRVRIKERFALVAGAASDLADAKAKIDDDGKVHRKSQQVMRQLKLRAVLPAAASLGISDAASAAALPVHVEVLRAGAVLADCSLAFHAEDEQDASNKFQFRLHGHVNGKGRAKQVHGDCADGIPVLASEDAFLLYATVADVRVNLMAIGDTTLAPTPTPTAVPTATP